jgi:murein DD-endopeptidase MepM/ murein hydrolase activator NlpD
VDVVRGVETSKDTRSHPGYPGCFEKDSTAPPPPAYPGIMHGFAGFRIPPERDDDHGRMLRLAVLLALATALLSAGTPTPAASARTGVDYPQWSWPVRGEHTIVRPFVAPETQYSAGHRGIDIAATGDVLAPADGVVHFDGIVVDRPVLSITQGGGILSSYEPVVSSLHAGEIVTRGEIIGHLAAGHCSQVCLHFGVRVNGQYVNPMLFLGELVRPVLLPTRHSTAGN